MPWGQNIQQKKHCNEFNKDLKKKKRSTSKKILKRKKELRGKREGKKN